MKANIFIVISAILLDQLSKYFFKGYLLNHEAYIVLTSFFNLVYTWNTGVSFSLFNDNTEFNRWLLISVSLIIVFILIFFWLKQEKDIKIRVALDLIIGGALGNVIDRLIYGAVFDFLDFHYRMNHWPAFNVADSLICIGAGLILLSIFIGKKRDA